MIKLNKNLKNIIRNKLNKNSTRIEIFLKNQKIKKKYKSKKKLKEPATTNPDTLA